MSKRLELHDIFIDILGTRNEQHSRVYFQPPSSVKIEYPCIIYNRNDIDAHHADDLLYKSRQGYLVDVIDPNPDSLIPEKVAKLPLCKFDRYYTADNLNHDVYIIYY